jgi:hypothetical protein
VLYAIRLLPLIGAVGLVGFVTVPSFLYLEPRSAAEAISGSALAIATGGVAVVAAGIFNSLIAWFNTVKFTSGCLMHSRLLSTSGELPVHEIPDLVPALLVAGVCRPKLLVSTGAVRLLDQKEIQAAIRHELGHLKQRDNLKKLLLRFCAFPLLAPLEQQWLRAAEIAADDAAAPDEGSSLDLASALVKIARAHTRIAPPELGMTLVPEAGTCVAIRIERLLSGRRPRSRWMPFLGWSSLTSVVLAAILGHTWILAQMHEFTELLVR